MAKQYLLGLDNGTTGVKCKIYDLEGNIMGEGYREYACVYPKPGWTEQEIPMLMEANYEALGDVLKKSGVDPSEVARRKLRTSWRACASLASASYVVSTVAQLALSSGPCGVIGNNTSPSMSSSGPILTSNLDWLDARCRSTSATFGSSSAAGACTRNAMCCT